VSGSAGAPQLALDHRSVRTLVLLHPCSRPLFSAVNASSSVMVPSRHLPR
jgi:hypothetical protein